MGIGGCSKRIEDDLPDQGETNKGEEKKRGPSELNSAENKARVLKKKRKKKEGKN